jgi:hypothetical protein
VLGASQLAAGESILRVATGTNKRHLLYAQLEDGGRRLR